MFRPLLAGIGLALVAAPALAADIDCGSFEPVKSATLPLEACVDPARWQASEAATGQEFLYFSKDNTAAFAIVTEPPAVTMNAYRQAILDFASTQSGQAVTAFDETTEEINGKAWRSMHYDATLQGSRLEFLNYYYSEQGIGSAQFIFWSLPTDAATVKTELADKVMATVRFGG